MIICSGCVVVRVKGGEEGSKKGVIVRKVGQGYYQEEGTAIMFACCMKLESR